MELMEWNGREISAKKKGEIPKHSQTKKSPKNLEKRTKEPPKDKRNRVGGCLP